jgi:hypothetical protein
MTFYEGVFKLVHLHAGMFGRVLTTRLFYIEGLRAGTLGNQHL